jgi:hypothetical protein
MKNLFNNISQEEKNRILEMHSGNKNVVSEQNPFSSQPSTTRQNPTPGRTIPNLTPGGTRPKPTPKPSVTTKAPQPKKIVENMTVNLYPDFGQSQQPKKHTIFKIINRNNSVELQLDKDSELSLTTDKLIFKCGSKDLKLENNVNDRGITVFNRELLKSLENQFCTSTKPSLSVPKVDFAMNNQSTNTTTGIA